VTRAAEADDLRRLNAATARLEPPFAVVDLAAFGSDAAGMTRRAAGTPIRLASKSVGPTRCGSATAWFRHAKAGEQCERFNELHLIAGSAITAAVPTYRGEGKAFG
jgi:D-serine deaminase-like pyridoxal phosphate-dependent protein